MTVRFMGAALDSGEQQVTAARLTIDLFPTSSGWAIRYRRPGSRDALVRLYDDGSAICGMLFPFGINCASAAQVASILTTEGEVEQNAVGIRYMPAAEFEQVCAGTHPRVRLVNADDAPKLRKLWATKPERMQDSASRSWSELASSVTMTVKTVPVSIPDDWYADAFRPKAKK